MRPKFFIFHSSFFISFGRAASSCFALLASGYPLHQPLRRFAPTRLVPLLSLSLPRPYCKIAIRTRFCFSPITCRFGLLALRLRPLHDAWLPFCAWLLPSSCCFRLLPHLHAHLKRFFAYLCPLHAHFKQNTCFRLNGLLQRLNGLLQRLNGLLQRLNGLLQWLNGLLQRLNGLLQRLNRLLQRLNRLLQRLNRLLQWPNGLLQRLNGTKKRQKKIIIWVI